ncbi:MAG: hypothetical protein IT289_02720 [Oligoflexia bacterium]|nr:hypothetical protein [Oligoflexia bacterium]
MRWALAVLVLNIIFAGIPSLLLAAPCDVQIVNHEYKGGQPIRLMRMNAFSPQGAAVLFVTSQGLKSVRQVSREFCRRGFSTVAVMDSQNFKSTDWNRSLKVTLREVKMRFNSLPVLVYGGFEQAQIAARFAKKNPKRVARLVLENPVFESKNQIDNLKRLSIQSRIFSCGIHSQKLKGLSRTKKMQVLSPQGPAVCRQDLHQSLEALIPMVDFLETDWAGVLTESWYWKKI